MRISDCSSDVCSSDLRYERFPTAEDRPPVELGKLEAIWKAPRGWARLTVVNNNYIGVYYVAAALLFFVLAGGLAVMMRTQLALPLNGVLSQETYNQERKSFV